MSAISDTLALMNSYSANHLSWKETSYKIEQVEFGDVGDAWKYLGSEDEKTLIGIAQVNATFVFADLTSRTPGALHPLTIKTGDGVKYFYQYSYRAIQGWGNETMIEVIQPVLLTTVKTLTVSIDINGSRMKGGYVTLIKMTPAQI